MVNTTLEYSSSWFICVVSVLNYRITRLLLSLDACGREWLLVLCIITLRPPNVCPCDTNQCHLEGETKQMEG